ncbi:hypothetical protein KEM52_006360 [Ascosphaera acerosa]|nr:hypothetical protein KEM52_006360 [Ascosphaera acerosa]
MQPLRIADRILRSNPSHGAVQALKALILMGQGRREEAIALDAKALRDDPNSYVCWHSHGLILQTEGDFDGAVKALEKSLELSPGNVAYLPNLAAAQAQTRDWQGHRRTQEELLELEPHVRPNWTALAMAYHLTGDYAGAEKVLEDCENTIYDLSGNISNRRSEALLYSVIVIAESGDLDRALQQLEAVRRLCHDRQAILSLRADLLLRLGRMDEASFAYTRLIRRNPDCAAYYECLMQAQGIPVTDPDAVIAFFDQWAYKFPRSNTPRRLPLDYLSGSHFKKAMDQYLRQMLRKAVLSTFSSIKSLYCDAEKRQCVQNLAEGYASTLATTAADDSSEIEYASSIYHFLAQHYDCKEIRLFASALYNIDMALRLAPSSVDFMMTKARIVKHTGELGETAEIMEAARKLDLKDRYINSKAVKYHLRNNDNETALDAASRFTISSGPGGTIAYLAGNQTIWYLIEDGEAYLRQRKLGLALKRLTLVTHLFDKWHAEQCDLYSFAISAGTIPAYLALARWMDRLRDHPYFTRASKSLVKAYLLLHDHPELTLGPEGIDPMAGLSELARRKAARRARKQRERELAEVAATRAAAATPGRVLDAQLLDPDPFGQELVETSDPLRQARERLAPLLKFTPRDVEVHCLAFEISIRLEKYLRALQNLQSAHAIDPEYPMLHVQIARLQVRLNSESSETSPSRAEGVQARLASLLSDQDLSSWNREYRHRNASSDAHVRAAREVEGIIGSLVDNGPRAHAADDEDGTQLANATSGLNLSDIGD